MQLKCPHCSAPVSPTEIIRKTSNGANWFETQLKCADHMHHYFSVKDDGSTTKEQAKEVLDHEVELYCRRKALDNPTTTL